MLKQAIAAALQHVRRQKQVVLTDLDKGVTGVHLNRIERSKASVSVEKLDAISRELGVHPLTILALAYGADGAELPTDLLKRISQEVTDLGGSVSPLEIKPVDRAPGRVADALERREQVQRLKASGMTKAQVARELGISKQTAARHW